MLSVAERSKLKVVELVYEAPLFILTEPVGAVVSGVDAVAKLHV